ncbi:hypothetical protein DXG03_005427 [Asterophora parasitica]|uniref:Nitronate monooxygenase domain-containing protein n=1 Tax=Asterophora parasitica TaxID=117018 RepID=A0A9P7KBG7_9AGAR|nr:hypothetical protein DXG03_005427 [Asterophora parasitica]
MAGAAGGALAARVFQGGGLGFIAYGYQSLEKLKSEVDTARALLKVGAQSPLPIGIGYLAWQLEAKPVTVAHDLLSVALENDVQAVWLSFGTEIPRWIKFIRDSERKLGETKIFVQVSSVKEALVACHEWKVDVIIAQGSEAGGHGSSTSPPLLTLLSEILSVIPNDGPPILGAGGLANGGHLAALIALGASGGVFGTRFLLSPESLYSDTARQALISARTGSSSGIAIDDLRRVYADGVRADDPDRMVIWAGAGVGLMNKIQPAKEIVGEIHEECVSRLQAAASSLG